MKIERRQSAMRGHEADEEEEEGGDDEEYEQNINQHHHFMSWMQRKHYFRRFCCSCRRSSVVVLCKVTVIYFVAVIGIVDFNLIWHRLLVLRNSITITTIDSTTHILPTPIKCLKIKNNRHKKNWKVFSSAFFFGWLFSNFILSSFLSLCLV